LTGSPAQRVTVKKNPDAPLAFGIAVVDDVGEDEVGGIDADAGLLSRLSDRAGRNRLAVLQMPGRRA
jgi:hypothetical protein